ncbi:MAG: NADH-quinone oxidoreductase subunit NuoK [Candidatus Korarchaeum sp.]|jgi:NADH-quinone oxidoreductase subunit K|nr:NADH-quinone oxidoreductase subunit NuoK [Candidatus Korarchaeum sp.]
MEAYWYLILSAVLLSFGIYGLLTRRNMIRMLLSAEIIFNAALLSLLSLASLDASYGPIGGAIAIISISLSAAEVGVIVSIAIMMFRMRGTLDTYELRRFRG